MKIIYTFFTLYILFFYVQSFGASDADTPETFSETNFSIDELLAANGETNVARYYTYYANRGFYTNDEKVKATHDSSGLVLCGDILPGDIILNTDGDGKYVLAMGDKGVHYVTERWFRPRFVPYAQVEEIQFRHSEKLGFRYVLLFLKE